MSNAKILLFGAYGMLGTALRNQLTDYTLITPTHSVVDITNRAAVRAYIQHHRPAIVINAAAYTNVDACEEQTAIAQQVNGAAPGYMAEAVEQLGAHLIHYSTDYVFAGHNPLGYAETDQPDQPVNAYGASKLAGERAIQQYTNRYSIIRTAWLYGSHGKNFVNTMLDLARTHSSLRVVNDQHGSPTYVVDLARATHAMLAQALPAGIYHATNAGVCTWYEFASEIFRQAGLAVSVTPCSSAEYPRPAQRPNYSILLNTKLPTLQPWQLALADYLATIDQT